MLGVSACAPPIPDGGFHGPQAASQIYAAIKLVRTYRGPDATASGIPPRAALEALVGMLDSSDPASRFVAVEALRDLTGETFGFDPSDPLPERATAAQRWKTWVELRQT